MDGKEIQANFNDHNEAILRTADLLERLISSSTKWQRDERVMMMQKVDEIRALATPETRDDD